MHCFDGEHGAVGGSIAVVEAGGKFNGSAVIILAGVIVLDGGRGSRWRSWRSSWCQWCLFWFGVETTTLESAKKADKHQV